MEEYKNLPESLKQIFAFVDTKKSDYIKCLADAVAIKSVSAWPEKRPDIDTMVEWTSNKLKSLGVSIELSDVGVQTLHNGTTINLPKVLLGTLGNDLSKKTVLIYGHLDVQPALKGDGWNTEPFILTEVDGKLFGRGSTDDKGPVLCWMHAIQAYQKLNIPLPVNLKFVLEGMEESGSLGLDELLYARKNDFLSSVDYVCISDNYWLGKEKPCITYGLRGICYFYIEVEGCDRDLHSGVFGGTVHEAMTDLIYLLNQLVDKDGKILIPNISNDVQELAPGERELYEKITFDIPTYRDEIGCKKLLHGEDKVQLLMHRWRYPCLSIHGIEGAFYESGQKTVIPRHVIGKFSIRLVPNQLPNVIEQIVKDYINDLWAKRGSPTRMRVKMTHSGMPWTEDPSHPHYLAARKATQHVYKMEPDMIREGCSIPILISLQETTGKNVLLLPIGASDDGAHSQNEKIDTRNYIEGIKLLGAYLYEVGKLE